MPFSLFYVHIEKIIRWVWILFCSPHAFLWLPTSKHESPHISCTLSNDIPKGHWFLHPNFILLKFPLNSEICQLPAQSPFPVLFAWIFIPCTHCCSWQHFFKEKSVKGVANSHHWYIYINSVSQQCQPSFLPDSLKYLRSNSKQSCSSWQTRDWGQRH